MWAIWSKHGDRRAWDSFALFDEARSAYSGLKPILSIDQNRIERLGHQPDPSVVSVVSVVKNFLDGLMGWSR